MKIFRFLNSLKRMFQFLLNKALIPFAIIHIRIIQYRYKKITTSKFGSHSSSNIAKLILLQAKEEYYNDQFSPWGKFCPKFSFSHKQMVRHIKFNNWLFPAKDFKEWELVVWHKSEAVTYYHNKIYQLQGCFCRYDKEILEQLKEWKDNAEKDYI